MDVETLRSLRGELDRFVKEFDDCFTEPTRRHFDVYVSGQLGSLQRKSVEPIAVEAGVPVRTLQEFLSFHRWEESDMRRTIRRIVVRDHFHADAIGVLDETTFPKKGTKTVGVQRQYCGALGKIENCISTVNLDYVTPSFHTLIDSDLYLPESWTNDRERCERAGVPAFVGYRAKWRIGLELIAHALGEGVPLRWITADEDYGRNPEFFDALDRYGLFFVIEVQKSTSGWTRTRREAHERAVRVDQVMPRGGPAWETFHIKDTTKGPVVWHARAIRFMPTWSEKELWLVVAEDVLTGEMKYFLSNAPRDATLESMLVVAFARWHVERSFEDAKQEIGLDHFEVRSYTAVKRHLAISMASLLFLARSANALNKKGVRTAGPSPRSEPLLIHS